MLSDFILNYTVSEIKEILTAIKVNDVYVISDFTLKSVTANILKTAVIIPSIVGTIINIKLMSDDEVVSSRDTLITNIGIDGVHFDLTIRAMNADDNIGTGTTDHPSLNNRDMPKQHPISAITGLTEVLESIVKAIPFMVTDITDSTYQGGGD